jgi:protein-disulfide isomerase
MKKKLNILIFTTLLMAVSTLASAQDDQSLASFILRNHEAGALPTVGNSDAEITVVEFFDYRCGYCAKQAKDFEKLLNESENVKIVYLEWPIFGDISDTAAKIALIIWDNNPDMYFDIHNGLMKLGPRMKKESIISLLNENNLDGEKIFNQALGQTENLVINENFKLAKNLGLRGTPASVINDSIYPGYIKYEVLSNLVK